MLRKRFSATLLALIVAAAAAIPGTALAADPADQGAKQGNDPGVLFTQAIGNEAVQATEGEAPKAAADPAAPAEQQTGAQTPAEVTPVPAAPETPAATDPATPADGGQTAEQKPAEDVTPVTDPAAPAEQPATNAAVTVDVTATEPAITAPEAVTPAAIEAVPEAATLTIIHRLTIGDQFVDAPQVVDGLTVGQEIDLTPYVVKEDWAECISQTTGIVLGEKENTIILEYRVREDSEVTVVIDNHDGDSSGEPQ